MSFTIKIFALLVFCLGFSASGSANNKQSFAVVSAHPLASQAGEQILHAGGNAFDAAIAVSAALAVVEPYGSGLGGGGFWLLHDSSSMKDSVVDGREVAPMEANAELYLDANGKLNRKSIDGPLAAGIPGVVAALEYISKNYAKLTLQQCLQPAIDLATNGFKPDPRYIKLAKFRLAALQASTSASSIFLDDGNVPDSEYVVYQKDLAATLAAISASGARAFYQGEIAKKLVAEVRKAGGIWTLEDLQQYRVIRREPIRTSYHGIEIIMPPPPTSGGVVISQILAMLEDIDVSALAGAEYIHTITESMRRAYKDRAQYLGDPAFTSIPLERLLDKQYARKKFADFDPKTATVKYDRIDQDIAKGEDTTHFSVLDAQGNYVAATLSINYPFGSGFVVPGTGVLLNDEMDDFSMNIDTPNIWGLVGSEANKVEPGKRMLSSMTPLFARDNSRTLIVGTPGGSRIISMLALALLEFNNGASAADIVKTRRFHHQFLPDQIQFELGAISASEQENLRKKGHKLHEMPRRYGNMQAIILHTNQNRIDAASDPRGHGQAIVQQ